MLIIRRAGADRVILPYLTGAHQMSNAAMYPNVIDFIDFASNKNQRGYSLEEFFIDASNKLVNHSLVELNLSRRLGLIVIGIKRGDEMIFNPSGDEIVRPDDILIITGRSEQLDKLDTLTIE